MKILFDHQIFSYQSYGGVSRYFYELITRLEPFEWDISVLLSNNYLLYDLLQINKINCFPFFPSLNFKRKERVMLELGKIPSLIKISQGNYDVLHLTHYESYCLNFTKKPIVITYHDKLFSSYVKNCRTVREQKRCFNRADAVVLISENTKKDFLSLFDFPENKTHVIYHGINTLPKKIELNKMNKIPYVLYVGGRAGYKNFNNFVTALSRIMKKDKMLRLVCTGQKFTEDEKQLLSSLEIFDKSTARFVSDTELQGLYAGAECFVFPSKYEGFGMPLLEAMSNDCPVCCSNAHCFPEIVGDAALLFDPDSVDDIEAKLNESIYSQDVKKILKAKGKYRVAMFSWEKSVKAHRALYNSLI